MKFILPALALLSSTFATSLSERQTTCYTGVYIINAPPRGSTTSGIFSTLISDLEQSIPDSYANVIQYDSGNANNSLAIASGVALMTQAIDEYAASCPGYAMVLSGWSQGGIVMMNTLCGNVDTGRQRLPKHYNKDIIGSVAYGQETYVPGMRYDKGTCTTGPSERPRVHPYSCRRFAGKILDYCDSGDQPCCDGTDPNAHYEYQHYDQDALDFIVTNYNARVQPGRARG